MPNTYTPDYLGWCAMIKTNGTPAQYNIPSARVIPYNLEGNAYPSVNNASAYPSIRYQGKKRSGFTIVAPCKKEWFTAAFVNSLLFNLSTQTAVNQTDLWSMKIYSSSGDTRVFDGARCSDLRITAGASGGPVMIQMGFLSRWGETECPYGATLPDGEVAPAAQSFTDPSSDNTRTGEAADIISYDWRSDTALSTTNVGAVWTATQVRGFHLSLMRGVNYVDYQEGTRYTKDIAVGGFTGVLSLEQSPTADVVPTTGATLRMHADNAGSPRFKFTLGLSMDDQSRPFDTGLGNLSRSYTLYMSSGGNPAAAATY